MIFTILNKTDLAPLMEIDDFISVVWNNKYYTAGEFELLTQTTPEKIEKIARDNFISLNGTDEIAIIELITFSEDEENGAIMTVKGSFAQSILNRRIFWETKKLSGNVIDALQGAIKNEALNPTIVDRSLNKTVDVKTAYGSLEENYTELRQVQKYGESEIYTAGTIDDNGIRSGFELSYINLPFYYNNQLLYFKDAQGVMYSRLYTKPLEDESYNAQLFLSPNESYIMYKARYFNANIFTRENVENLHDEVTHTGRIMSFRFKLSQVEGVSIADQVPLSNNLASLTKAEYEAGNFGVALFDNYLYFRFGYSNYVTTFIINNYHIYPNSDPNGFALYAFWILTGYKSPDSEYRLFNENSYILYSLPNYAKIPVSCCDSAGNEIAIDWKTSNPIRNEKNTLDNSILYIEYVKVLMTSDIFVIGKSVEIDEEIAIDVYGENLLERVEEIAELYGVGIKARKGKKPKIIYEKGRFETIMVDAVIFDFYKGANRSNNIVFSENLDNLNSYTVNIANGGANVALVYSKDGETEYTGEAGAGAGTGRREIFVNKTDKPGYIDAGYTASLAEEGQLSLQGVKITIESEVDANSYVYRTQFNLGDIVKMQINDLGIEQVIRILEVREYQDENGYFIDLILGE